MKDVNAEAYWRIKEQLFPQSGVATPLSVDDAQFLVFWIERFLNYQHGVRRFAADCEEIGKYQHGIPVEK